VKKEWIIAVDDREKRPLPLPQNIVMLDPEAGKPVTVRIHAIKRRLEHADYVVDPEGVPYWVPGFTGAGLVERKLSIDEIAQNVLIPDKLRRFDAQLAAMRRMWAYPVLLLEATPARFARPTFRTPAPAPSVAHDVFQRLLLKHGVSLHFCPGPSITDRGALGEWTVRLLINAQLTPPAPISRTADPA